MGKIRETLAAIVQATGMQALEADYVEQGLSHLRMEHGRGFSGWKLSADVDSLCSPDESEGSLSVKAKLTLRFYATNAWKDGPRVHEVIEHLREVLAVFNATPKKRAVLLSDGRFVKTPREQRMEALLFKVLGVTRGAPNGSLLRALHEEVADVLSPST